MGELEGKREIALSVKVLLSAGGATGLACMIGFCIPLSQSLAEPALLWLAIPAGVFGVVAGRVYLGALFSPLFAIAGALGIAAQHAAPDSYSPAVVGIHFVLAGLVCVVAGAIGGLIGDLGKQGPGGREA